MCQLRNWHEGSGTLVCDVHTRGSSRAQARLCLERAKLKLLRLKLELFGVGGIQLARLNVLLPPAPRSPEVGSGGLVLASLCVFLRLGRVSMTQPFGHELALQTNTTILLCMSVAPTASIGSSIQRLGRTRQSTHST